MTNQSFIRFFLKSLFTQAYVFWLPQALLTAGHVFTPTVVSGSRESSEIGLEVLRQGGNAVDAAVAVSLALGVSEPYGSGLGGKLVMLYFHRESAAVHVLEGIESAPAGFDPEAFRRLPDARRINGLAPVGIPGTLPVLESAHRDFGSKPWAELVLPAAALARSGFEVTEPHQGIFRASFSRLLSGMGTASLFTQNRRLPEVGSRMTNLPLANTLERVARNGASELHSRDGVTAQLMVRFFERHNVPLEYEDLESYVVRRPPPLEIPWGSYRYLSAPGPTAGGALVGFTLLGMDALPPAEFGTPEFYHRFSTALREAYRLLDRGFGDRRTPGEDQQQFLNETFFNAFRQTVRQAYARPPTPGPFTKAADEESDPVEESTTHFIVMDAGGNVVSATQSIGSRFGSAAVVDGTGILLNNTLRNFAFFTPSSPNFAAPGLRPRSTVSPSILLKEDQFVMAIGAPGGQRIPSGVAQIVQAVLVNGVSLQEAVEHPRFHLRRALTRREPDRFAEFEPEVDPEVAERFSLFGWEVRIVETRFYFGGVNGLYLHPATGSLEAFGDPRRSNVVRQAEFAD